MRNIAIFLLAFGLAAAACDTVESEDEVVVLEEGTYTAILQVEHTWEWQSVTWEEGHGFTVRFGVVESSEEIDSARISVWPNKTDFSIVFRDSSLPVIMDSGKVGVSQLYPLRLSLTDEQREEVLALNVGDTITIRYNKVVPDSSVASVSDEPEISVADYYFDNETYIELDEALSWRGDHSRVNVEFVWSKDQ